MATVFFSKSFDGFILMSIYLRYKSLVIPMYKTECDLFDNI